MRYKVDESFGAQMVGYGAARLTHLQARVLCLFYADFGRRFDREWRDLTLKTLLTKKTGHAP